MADTAWAKASRILCIRLDNVGDVFMTTPAIKAVKESFPKASLTLLSSSSGAEAADLVPYIDSVRVFQAPWVKSDVRPSNVLDEIHLLQREHFDAAIIFTVYSQNPMASALLCYLAGIPLRLGYSRENIYGLLTHPVIDPEPHTLIRHEVQRQLDLVSSIGCFARSTELTCRVGNEARAAAASLLASLGIDDDEEVIAVHPGASAPSRRYEPEGFAEAGRLLLRNKRRRLVVTGNKDEKELSDFVARSIGSAAVSVAGKLTLEGLAALLERSSLLISNNSGPAHIAAATGTPAVIIYALTNPQHRPWGIPHRVLFHDVSCKFCYKSVCPFGQSSCIRLVRPDEVAAAAEEVLFEGRVKYRSP